MLAGCDSDCFCLQGASSSSQFWAEHAKQPVEYVAGFADAVQAVKLAADKNVIMDFSEATFAFYWSAGTAPVCCFVSVTILMHDVPCMTRTWQ